MPKNLVFLSDGTGNDADFSGATNVYKLYQRLRCDIPGHENMPPARVDAHLKSGNVRQITQYDAGIGSRKTDFVGKATGRGISKNIKDGYEFLVRFYEPGDRVYLFGFSRGAYTVRSLGGMVSLAGIARRRYQDRDLLVDEELRIRYVEDAFRIYKTEPGPEGAVRRAELGEAFINGFGYPEHKDKANRAVYFIGVWDTVRSLGLPIYWTDIELPGFSHRFHDHNLSRYVKYAFHALSIDDPRLQFWPTIWNEPTEAQLAADSAEIPNEQVFEQVWFPGVHGDVGGGYEKSGLSDLSLIWMIDKIQAASASLLFYGVYADNPELGLSPNSTDHMHNPLNTIWRRILYQEEMRNVCRGIQEPKSKKIEQIGDPPLLHRSWLNRVAKLFTKRDRYLPENTAEHPDAKTATGQLDRGTSPPPGPFAHVVGRNI